jgi:hypothetical protein
MKKLLFVPLAALLLALPANAGSIQTLTLQQPQGSDQDLHALIEVQSHRSVASVIAVDALYGGLVGLAIGAGVGLLQNDGNWGRDLAIGAGAGLIVGGIFGAVDAVSYSDRARPIGEMREIGFSRGVSPVGGHF